MPERRRSPLSLPGWSSWTYDRSEPFALGRLGFSYRSDDHPFRADLYPVQGTQDTLTTWEAIIWEGNDREPIRARFTHDDPWDLADMVMSWVRNNT